MADINIDKKPLPLSESFFDLLVGDGYYYVDKTLFIKDLLARKARVVLCTRPRRFGKTLNQTMLKSFFEDYDEMVGFIRPLLSSALKDNPHLQLAVMTGCLRVSKESIFTGLNNNEIDDDAENLWNFLFFTGYLKKEAGERQSADGELTLELSIPNEAA